VARVTKGVGEQWSRQTQYALATHCSSLLIIIIISIIIIIVVVVVLGPDSNKETVDQWLAEQQVRVPQLHRNSSLIAALLVRLLLLVQKRKQKKLLANDVKS